MLGFKNPIEITPIASQVENILRIPGGAARRASKLPRPVHLYELFLPYSNGYLFKTAENTYDLIDGGIWRGGDDELQQRLDFILEYPIRKIIITHNHFDHFAGVCHKIKELHPDIPIYSYQPPYPKKIPFHPYHTGGTEYLAHLYLNHFNISEQYLTIPFDFNLFQEKDIIIGKYHFNLIPTPGHSYDGVCYYNEEKKIIITGDTLISNPIRIKHKAERVDLEIGAGPSITITGDNEELKQSLEVLSQIEFDVLLPGHGNPIIKKGLNHWVQHNIERMAMEAASLKVRKTL